MKDVYDEFIEEVIEGCMEGRESAENDEWAECIKDEEGDDCVEEGDGQRENVESEENKKSDECVDNNTQHQYNYKDIPSSFKKVADVAKYRKNNGISLTGPLNIHPLPTFNHLPLFIDILNKQGITAPTPIQAQVLPILLSNKDASRGVVGIAPTGSGKTLAYALPCIIHAQGCKDPAVLVLAPTRELCLQLHAVFVKYASPFRIPVGLATGGTSLSVRDARKAILIGTPGRVLDLLNRRVLNLKGVKLFVVDEVDQMADNGFLPQVGHLLSCCTGKAREGAQCSNTDNINNTGSTKTAVQCRVAAFSATLTPHTEHLLKSFSHYKVEISNTSQITHKFIKSQAKLTPLLTILKKYHKTLIFVNKQDTADSLAVALLKEGYAAASLHSGREQADRSQAVEDFSRGRCAVLVATSVAARGLDIPLLDVVVNYDCPVSADEYVHRIGRTGRSGRKGDAYTIVGDEDGKYLVNLGGVCCLKDVMDLVDGYLERMKRGDDEVAGKMKRKGLLNYDRKRKEKMGIEKRGYEEGSVRMKMAEDVAQRIGSNLSK